MAGNKDYTGITDAEVAAGQPYTTSLATRMRDDPIAGMQGDAEAITDEVAVFVDYDAGAGAQTGVITDETDDKKVLKPDGSGSVAWGTVAPAQSWNPTYHTYARSYTSGPTLAQYDWSPRIAQVTDVATWLWIQQGYAPTKSVLDTTPAFASRTPRVQRDGTIGTPAYSDSWGGTTGNTASGAEEFEVQFGELERGTMIILGGTHDDGQPWISYAMGIMGVKIAKDLSGNWEATFYGSWNYMVESSSTNDPANVFSTTANKDNTELFTLLETDGAYTEKVRVGNTKGRGSLYGYLEVSGDYLIAHMRVESQYGTQGDNPDNRGSAGVWWESTLMEDQT